MTQQNKIYRRYRIRLYPNIDQEQLLWKHMNCCRFIWNHLLNIENEHYENDGSFIGRFDLIRMITEIKNNGYEWLKEVSNTSLQLMCTDLSKAFKRFFIKKSNRPKFKSKKSDSPSFPIRSEHVYFTDSLCNIEKIGKVKYKTDLVLPMGEEYNNFRECRVIHELNKWYLSIVIKQDTRHTECENQAFNMLDKSLVGIDLGVKRLAVVSFNDNFIEYPNINRTQKMIRLSKYEKHLQRIVSRKYRVNGDHNKTKNIIRLENKIFKTRRKLSNIRGNYIHQITNDIVKYKPDRVVMETLCVSDMMKDKHLSKDIQDQNFYKFISIMKYKCESNNIEFRQVPRFYPSSKTCSCCGHIHRKLKLKDRRFICPKCGLDIDRDYNAALNLKNYNFI